MCAEHKLPGLQLLTIMGASYPTIRSLHPGPPRHLGVNSSPYHILFIIFPICFQPPFPLKNRKRQEMVRVPHNLCKDPCSPQSSRAGDGAPGGWAPRWSSRCRVLERTEGHAGHTVPEPGYVSLSLTEEGS